jgi:hypothetical protein
MSRIPAAFLEGGFARAGLDPRPNVIQLKPVGGGERGLWKRKVDVPI